LDVTFFGLKAALTRVQSSPYDAVSTLDDKEANLLIWGVLVHEMLCLAILKGRFGKLKYTVLRLYLNARNGKGAGGSETDGWKDAESSYGSYKEAPTKSRD
jgi:hypothetical protein